MDRVNHYMPGTMVYVSQDYPSPSRVRAAPSLGARVIGRLAAGAVAEVLGGPAFDDGHTFWQVQEPISHQVGWISQGTEDVLYLAPIVPHTPCPNAASSLLRPGDRAMVALQPPVPNHVRSDEGLAGQIIGAIEPGEFVSLIEGPACADGYVWWRVVTDSGLRGWTAEGEVETRWLIPIVVHDRSARTAG